MREPKKRHSKSVARSEFTLFTTTTSYSSTSKRVKHGVVRLTVKESFCLEFSEDIDLFSLDESFPDWALRFREGLLNGIDRNFRRICYKVKSLGIKFFVFYPIEIGGKWKFADVFIPKTQTVILVVSFASQLHSPCNVKSGRELWFSSAYRVVAVYPDELDRLGDAIVG